MHSELSANGLVDLCCEREPFGVARAACFEELAGVFTSELRSESPYFRIERLSKFSTMTLGKIVSNNVLVTIPQREQD